VNRWIRLSAAVIAMMMAGNSQYAWTLFRQPISAATGWKPPEVQFGFALFIALGTWAMPLSGILIDRIGPRAFIMFSGILCGIGWGWMGYAHTLTQFYVLYSIAGFGGAFVYCGSIAMALKWFPDRRGLASGLAAAGYGAGAMFFNPLFAYLIHTIHFQLTLFYTGIAQGCIILCAGLLLQNPPKGAVPAPVTAKARVRRHSEEFNSWEMLRTPQFYVLYIMMLMIGIGGLMVTANLADVANNFKIGAAALTIALSLNPAANGGGRIFWGWVSDHMGRERTMFVGFFLQAIFLGLAATVGRSGNVAFVLLMALIYFTWGELYVLFPAVLADIFGARHSATNYSILYSTKGLAVFPASWLAALLFEKTGSWDAAFYISAGLAMCSALGSIGLRKMPLPKKHGSAAVAESVPAVPQVQQARAAK
jgi:OFA family oxalate/formate antiporter-like MFS transporter